MARQLILPASAPYALTGAKLALFQSLYGGINDTIAPIVAGDGSLNDDDDSTGVTLNATQNGSGTSDCSVVGVDFAPIGGTVGGSFDTMFRFARVMVAATSSFDRPQYLSSEWAIMYGTTPTVGGSGGMTDALPYALPSEFNLIPNMGTTWETTDWQYAWATDPATVVAGGFTLAFAVEITTASPTDVSRVFNVTEVGLYVDVAGGMFPLTRYPRAGVSGPSRARRRLTRRPGNY